MRRTVHLETKQVHHALISKCPGRYLARETAFITISCLLWAFKINNAADKAGKTIVLDDMAYSDWIVVYDYWFFTFEEVSDKMA